MRGVCFTEARVVLRRDLLVVSLLVCALRLAVVCFVGVCCLCSGVVFGRAGVVAGVFCNCSGRLAGGCFKVVAVFVLV